MTNIHKCKNIGNFSSIQRDILTSTDYTANEIRLYLVIVGLPEDWVINKMHLQKTSGITRSAFMTAWTKLEEKGHIIQKGVEQKGNGWPNNVYTFYANLDDNNSVGKQQHEKDVNSVGKQHCDSVGKQHLTNNILTNNIKKPSKEGKKSSYPTNLFDMIYERYEKDSDMNKLLCSYLGMCLRSGKFTEQDWGTRLDSLEDIVKRNGLGSGLDSVKYAIRGNGNQPYYKFYDVAEYDPEWVKEERQRENKTVTSSYTGVVF